MKNPKRLHKKWGIYTPHDILVCEAVPDRKAKYGKVLRVKHHKHEAYDHMTLEDFLQQFFKKS